MSFNSLLDKDFLVVLKKKIRINPGGVAQSARAEVS